MLKLADPRVQAFLADSMIVELATLSPKQRPFVTPLWFVLHDGVVHITTGAGTWAGRNIQEHPQVTLLFHGGQAPRPDAVLRMRGTAACHYGLPPWPALLRIAAKYYLSPSALLVELGYARWWLLRTRYYGQAKGGVGYIRVVPVACELLPRPAG